MPASYETHRAQLKAILSAWGMPEDNAETTADILSWADLHGVDNGAGDLPVVQRPGAEADHRHRSTVGQGELWTEA